MKILVIDDEKPTLSMFKLFLTAYGYEAVTADSGETGLEVFKDIKPDMVFTDIRMPGIDGIEVLKQIRAHDPRCQVIIITGHGDLERAVEALDQGASDFINKPVERQALNAALARAEHRLNRPDPKFSLLPCEDSPKAACFHIQGKLTQKSAAPLSMVREGLDPGAPVEFRVSPDIAMDRAGISIFIDTLKALSSKGHALRITGLSYNILRLMEMAGIHKMAALEAEKPEVPGL